MRFVQTRAKRSTPRVKNSTIPSIRIGIVQMLSKLNPLYALPLALIALSFLCFSRMTINTVECFADESVPCSAEVQSIADQNMGKQALFLDPKSIETTFAHALPQFETVVAAVQLPSTLVVNLEQSQPLAQIVTASESASLLVNTKMVITEFSPTPYANLFQIQSLEPLQPEVGSVIKDPGLLAATQLYALLLERDIPMTSVTVASAQRIEVVSQSIKLLFTSFKSLEHQVASLQIILGTDTMETNPRVIDLRPQRPVLQ